jgi:hypothetical protein
MMSHSLRLLLLVVASSLAVVAMPAQAGSTATAGLAIGFARVNLGDGTVTAYGGRGTRSVTTGESGGAGRIVSFSGKYAKNLTVDQVLVQATAEASDGEPLAVANAVVSLASATQIIITVHGWTAGTATPITGNVFLTVYSGLTPKE